MIESGLEEHPDNPSLLYDLACLEALSGESDAAIKHLRRAVELKPEYAQDAQKTRISPPSSRLCVDLATPTIACRLCRHARQ